MMDMKTDTLNLVPAIKEIECQISRMELDFSERIAPYKKSLEHLRKINMACEKCCGKGKVLRKRSCAEDDRPNPDDPSDYVTCDACHGTGLASNQKE